MASPAVLVSWTGMTTVEQAASSPPFGKLTPSSSAPSPLAPAEGWPSDSLSSVAPREKPVDHAVVRAVARERRAVAVRRVAEVDGADVDGVVLDLAVGRGAGRSETAGRGEAEAGVGGALRPPRRGR